MTEWNDIGRAEDLTDLAPEATAAFARVLEATAMVDEEGLGSDPRVRAWTEQFVMDVASIDDDLRADVAAALGAELFPYAVATWAADMGARLRSAWTQLGGAEPRPGPAAAEDGTDAWPAVEHFLVEVARLDQLDAITTEVVRLRGARANNCRLCRSRRSVDAVRAGADEATFDAIDTYESSDLAEPLKVALRVTDAILWTPATWPKGLAEEVRSSFSPEQAVELVYDVLRNAANRIAVALGVDQPEVTEGVEWFKTDPEGTLTYGLPTPG